MQRGSRRHGHDTVVWLVGVALAVTAANANAGQAREWLATLIEDTETLSAQFSQYLLDEDGTVDRRSSGTVELAKPGRFRWHYTEPYEQLLVGDGQHVWIYEPDLEQVQIRPIDEAARAAPASFLGRAEDLESEYDVDELGSHNGLEWVRLEPQASVEEFDAVFLGFEQGTLRVMELQDSFGQTTSISFRDVRTGVAIAPERFEFDPPDGVDVLGQDPHRGTPMSGGDAPGG